MGMYSHTVKSKSKADFNLQINNFKNEIFGFREASTDPSTIKLPQGNLCIFTYDWEVDQVNFALKYLPQSMQSRPCCTPVWRVYCAVRVTTAFDF